MAKKTAKKVAVDGSESLTVTWSGGSRVYSKEVHGDSFADNATEFAAKVGGTVA